MQNAIQNTKQLPIQIENGVTSTHTGCFLDVLSISVLGAGKKMSLLPVEQQRMAPVNLEV